MNWKSLPFLLLVITLLSSAIKADCQELTMLSAQEKNRFRAPENRVLELKKELEFHFENEDTLKQINKLVEIAHFYGNQARYKESYDNLWKALYLAEKESSKLRLEHVYLKLGRHYGYYKRSDEAKKYFNLSLSNKKTLIAQGILDSTLLVENYFSICSFYREYENIEMQQLYLDSCRIFYKKKLSGVLPEMMQMQQAVIESRKGNLTEADKIFRIIVPELKKTKVPYSIISDYFYAKNLIALGHYSEAIKKLEDAIKVGEMYNSHIDFIPKIYDAYAQIYLKTGQVQKAFQMKEKVNAWNFEIFDSRSVRNRPLLEIQDEYTLNKEKEAIEIQRLQFEELEKNAQILFLQRTLLALGFLASLIIVFIYVRNLRNKHLLEKVITKSQRDLEFDQIQMLVELKNKELATSALKLIEKEEIVTEFEKSAKKKSYNPNSKDIKAFLRAWGRNSDRGWEEFQKRFIDINKSFYDNLHSKYPSLTATEDKLCALIKLQFSSKQISELLGISIESVHVSRSRLRKSLKLSRDINLTQFISQF